MAPSLGILPAKTSGYDEDEQAQRMQQLEVDMRKMEEEHDRLLSSLSMTHTTILQDNSSLVSFSDDEDGGQDIVVRTPRHTTSSGSKTEIGEMKDRDASSQTDKGALSRSTVCPIDLGMSGSEGIVKSGDDVHVLAHKKQGFSLGHSLSAVWSGSELFEQKRAILQESVTAGRDFSDRGGRGEAGGHEEADGRQRGADSMTEEGAGVVLAASRQHASVNHERIKDRSNDMHTGRISGGKSWGSRDHRDHTPSFACDYQDCHVDAQESESVDSKHQNGVGDKSASDDHFSSGKHTAEKAHGEQRPASMRDGGIGSKFSIADLLAMVDRASEKSKEFRNKRSAGRSVLGVPVGKEALGTRVKIEEETTISRVRAGGDPSAHLSFAAGGKKAFPESVLTRVLENSFDGRMQEKSGAKGEAASSSQGQCGATGRKGRGSVQVEGLHGARESTKAHWEGVDGRMLDDEAEIVGGGDQRSERGSKAVLQADKDGCASRGDVGDRERGGRDRDHHQICNADSGKTLAHGQRGCRGAGDGHWTGSEGRAQKGSPEEARNSREKQPFGGFFGLILGSCVSVRTRDACADSSNCCTSRRDGSVRHEPRNPREIRECHNGLISVRVPVHPGVDEVLLQSVTCRANLVRARREVSDGVDGICRNVELVGTPDCVQFAQDLLEAAANSALSVCAGNGADRLQIGEDRIRSPTVRRDAHEPLGSFTNAGNVVSRAEEFWRKRGMTVDGSFTSNGPSHDCRSGVRKHHLWGGGFEDGLIDDGRHRACGASGKRGSQQVAGEHVPGGETLCCDGVRGDANVLESRNSTRGSDGITDGDCKSDASNGHVLENRYSKRSGNGITDGDCESNASNGDVQGHNVDRSNGHGIVDGDDKNNGCNKYCRAFRRGSDGGGPPEIDPGKGRRMEQVGLKLDMNGPASQKVASCAPLDDFDH